MTVLASRNAYGGGCPWTCTQSTVSYDLAQFPVTRKHCDWHTGMTFPLRAPNTPSQADAIADAWIKVMANVDQVERVES